MDKVSQPRARLATPTVQDWNSDDADKGPAKPQSLSATSNGSALIMLSLSFGRATCEPLEDVKPESHQAERHPNTDLHKRGTERFARDGN